MFYLRMENLLIIAIIMLDNQSHGIVTISDFKTIIKYE